MEKRSNHFSFEDRERRESAQFIDVTMWVFGPDPDPTYDPDKGWKLDQFATRFMPDRVRNYKEFCASEYPTPIPTEPFALSFEKIEIRGKLSGATKQHLLNTRFEVRGIPFGENEPVVIHKALLESMFFSIETSEVREQSVPYETARRFDHVRVFDLAAAAKSSGGRNPTYNWPRLAEHFTKEKPIFAKKCDLIAYCREHATVIPGKRGSKYGPDASTLAAPIKRYGWEKTIRST
jgi:hypothetical protein